MSTPGPVFSGTVITGQRGTGNINQNRRVVDMSKEIFELEPDSSPLVVISSKLGKMPAINPKFQWLEDEGDPRWDLLNGALSAGDTVLVVDNGAFFAVGDMIKVPRTKETMEVTVVSGNNVTVTRSVGAIAAAALLDNDPLQLIGNANQEGATSRVLKSVQIKNKFNYCQIFRLPFGVTGTEMNSELYGGPDLPYQRKKKGIMFLQDVERAFLFGEQAEDTSGTHPKRYTGGLVEFITTNATNAGGTLTEATLETWFRQVFRYGSKKRTMFASPLVMSAISGFARGKLALPDPAEDTYGISIMKYLSPHGTINLVKHNLLEGDVWGGYAFLLDLEHVKYRYLRNRDMKLRTNIQANDADSESDEYLGEVGLQLMHERLHGVLTGVTG